MARSRVYRHDVRCPDCGSKWTPKDGHSRGEQTYRCRDCQHRFTPEGNRHYFPEAVKRQALDMYAEGAGITATGGCWECSRPPCSPGSKKPAKPRN